MKAMKHLGEEIPEETNIRSQIRELHTDEQAQQREENRERKG